MIYTKATTVDRRAFVLCIRVLVAIAASATPALAGQFGFTIVDRSQASSRTVSAIEFASHKPASILVGAGNLATIYRISGEGKLITDRTLEGSDGEVTDLAVHVPSHKAALSLDSGNVQLYDLRDGSTLARLGRVHRKGATSVTFTSDGRYLVTGGAKGDLRIFTGDGTAVAELSESAMGHERQILELFAVPPGHRVISVGVDRRVILWDLDTRRAIRPTLMEMDIRSAALGGPETLALGLQLLRGNLHRGSGFVRARETKVTDTVRVVDPQSGNRVLELEGLTQNLDTVAVTPDGRFIAAAGSKELVSIFDATSGQIVTELPLDSAAKAMQFSRDGKWFVIGSEAGSLTLFELTGVLPAPAAPSTVQAPPIVVVLIEPKILISNRAAGGKAPVVDRGSLEIRGRIQSDVPLKSLEVDGREITSLIPIDDDLMFTAFVPLEAPGQRQIDIVAENMAGATWKESFVVERAREVAKKAAGPGSRRALIIGISEYAEPSINLDFAARDAHALHRFLTSPERGPGRFEERNVRLLVDRQATVAGINRGLREFLQRAREEDFVLVFFAGHGMPDPNQLDDFYLLAHDTRPDSVAGTGIPMHHVREALAQVKSRDVLILTDSCHSAGIAAPRGMRSLTTNPIHSSFLEKMRHSSGGMAILTASEAAQVSLEGPEWNGHGVFSYFLLKGLDGAADNDGDHIVALGELMEYVRRQVMEATSNEQIPAIGPTSFDRQFPLVPVEPGNPTSF